MSVGLFTTITGLERKNWRGGFREYWGGLIQSFTNVDLLGGQTPLRYQAVDGILLGNYGFKISFTNKTTSRTSFVPSSFISPTSTDSTPASYPTPYPSAYP